MGIILSGGYSPKGKFPIIQFTQTNKKIMPKVPTIMLPDTMQTISKTITTETMEMEDLPNTNASNPSQQKYQWPPLSQL